MISTNYTDYLTRKHIRTADYLRVISDFVSANNDVNERLEKTSKLVKVVQKRLSIPERQEVAVGILAVLFNHSRIYGKVPFKRLKTKMGLVDLLNPLVVEDFIYLINNKYIILEKSVSNIEYICLTDVLYKKLYQEMTEENERLFMMVAGKTLTDGQLKFFKTHLFNEGLNIGELFLTCVSCQQYEAAKLIINFGWDMNRENELMAYELFICANYNFMFCIDFYLMQGLKITVELLSETLRIAEQEQEYFDMDNTYNLIEELKSHVLIE